uniref:alpha/beta fold hydrolase n=1 Tax=Sphingomonas populi TaxID=2484750 RepID=UPI0013EEC057|nr:alpha/beta fold hydrolase [Sphingomonas populi]
MATFHLVPGGFHGKWCWDRVVPELQTMGHKATGIELPGMGGDDTPHKDVTLDLWARHLIDLAEREAELPVLVGHSRAGLAMIRAAELAPDRFASLVFLSAVVPPQGEAMGSHESFSQVPYMRIVNEGHTLIASEDILPLLFNGCSAEDVKQAATGICPEPLAPWTVPITTTEERFGTVRRAYIHCLQDKMLPYDWQLQVASRLGCTRSVTMDTDHSPFLNSPQELARHIGSLA